MKTLIKKQVRITAFAASVMMLWGVSMANAQEKVEVSVGADVVSGYIWRGTDCGGVSIQPGISVAKSGFSLAAWGSVGIDSDDTKEIDLVLGYEKAGFSASITDYWFDDADRYFDYKAHGAHLFEGTVGYDFGIFSLSWNTYFAGNDYKANGKRAYSSYIEAIVPFTLDSYNFAFEIGGTPWEGAYSDKCNVTNIALGVQKDIKITESFTLPLFAKVITNPFEDKSYFTVGFSF